jgi:hypothetical protein
MHEQRSKLQRRMEIEAAMRLSQGSVDDTTNEAE